MKRKKYTGTGESGKGEYCVINVITKEIVADNKDIDSCKIIANGYNHKYCKPNFPDKYFVKHKKEIS